MTLTLTDMFCGAGGSSTGAVSVPGVEVRVASNHWSLAIETHNTNHPDADHIQADLSTTDPRYFPSSDLLWASPECTNHSRAKGRKLDTLQNGLWGESLPDEAAERSRATMWDVVRFAEVHRYRMVFVENVVEVADWLPFRSWLLAMESLGYNHQTVSLNSMHAQAYGLPAPQSRDRLYIVFHRKGDPKPDFAGRFRPRAYCPGCDEVVDAIQAFKKAGSTIGRYRSQYVYRCPRVACRNQIVEPAWLPASSIIDWSLRGQRIGDRSKPLAEKTRRRIAAGIARYWGNPMHLEAAGNTYDAADPKHPQHGNPNSYYRAWSVDEPLRTLHTIESKALAVPVEGRDGKTAQPTDRPLRTQTTRLETGLAFIAHLKGSSDSQIAGAHSPVLDPMHTIAAGGNHHALVTSYYGNNDGALPVTSALPTVTTTDRHALIMRNNSGGAEMVTPAGEVLRTITTAAHQSLLTPGDIAAAEAQVDDVLFRMLEPTEAKKAMAFPEEYVMLGNRREQVRLAGNAVTPPAARDLISVGIEAFLGAS
ncbi:DNA cytosine methyltransferase [Phycicoccus mangrovi]|uniref:DNA cytosine methyltransferase n=1 Tax=Phycicoccus mangrovi TaxID=2840470 RepID=UPI0027E227D2|nr:DNA cytosine methyltransferase [Phycicoccus mangrovi]